MGVSVPWCRQVRRRRSGFQIGAAFTTQLIHTLFLISIVLDLCVSSPDWTDECPSACRCKWSSGKKTALCRDAGFTAIPASLNSDMQVLDLTGNAIPYLTEDAFRSVGLINLQRIFVRNARVREVHKDAFRDLIILVEVDLTDNLITSLHPDTFVGNLRLKVLYLSGNPLRELRSEQFAVLPHLRTIELVNCHLTLIHHNAFKHVTGLESLNLKDNKLSYLSETVFGPIAQLKTLILDGNPWYCDCRLRGFRNWFLSSNLHRIPTPCYGPRKLAGHTWQTIQPQRFACPPEVKLTDQLIQVESGGNVTIGCHVRGDPEPKVTWLYNEREIGSVNATNPDQVLLIEVEEGLLDKWINLSVINVSDLDAGDYSCVAQNIEGTVIRNVTLVLPTAVIVSTLSHNKTNWLWVWLVGAGSCIFVIMLIASVCAVCVCSRKQRRRKRHRRKARLKGSVSFTDQEKKLLDLSITTTERQSTADSCEMLGGSLMMDIQPSSVELPLDHLQQSSTMASTQPELMQQFQGQPMSPLGIEICEQQSPQPAAPPVHITIESHTKDGIVRSSTGLPTIRETNSSGCSSGTSNGLPIANGQTVTYPATLGVYPPPPEFSTSILPVGAFGNILISVSVSQDPNIDIQRYPDLLDIPHRSNHSVGNNVGGGKALSKAISIATGPDMPYCTVSESYATLPRRQLRPNIMLSATSTSNNIAAHYDNMGPRVTAGGSCSTLSLPDVDPNSLIRIPEDIPPPPPPPICSPLTGEYVSL